MPFGAFIYATSLIIRKVAGPYTHPAAIRSDQDMYSISTINALDDKHAIIRSLQSML